MISVQRILQKNILSSGFLLRLAQKILPKNDFGDKAYALVVFVVHQNRLPDFSNGGVNDACFFIKASNEIMRPERTFTSDKEHLKIYVAKKVGEQYTVPTLAVLHSLSDVEAYSFEPGCVIKPTHMSGEVIFYNRSSDLEIERIQKWFSINYYDWTRERNYKFLTPKIIVEPVIFPEKSCDDYKVFCLNGRAKFLKIEIDRAGNHQHAIYTPDWKRVNASFSTNRSQPASKDVPEPRNLQQILSIAERLASDFSFIRVDCYTDGEKVYVGELTNVPGDTRSIFNSSSEEQLIKSLLFTDGGIRKELLKK